MTRRQETNTLKPIGASILGGESPGGKESEGECGSNKADAGRPVRPTPHLSSARAEWRFSQIALG